jgi:hypothetical protein
MPSHQATATLCAAPVASVTLPRVGNGARLDSTATTAPEGGVNVV